MMRYSFYFLSLLLIFISACNSGSNAPAELSIAQSQQLVVVEASNWNYFQGGLYLYEREGPEKPWTLFKSPIPVVLGMEGLAWGRGLEDFRKSSDGPNKKEGDKRSPAGVFPLTSTFGYASVAESGISNMPYIEVSGYTRCIEDSKSQYYNAIVDEREVKNDWKSADAMLRDDELYRWGVFVGHNQPEAEAGAGSCIFMHTWRSENQGTLGCTAMDQVQLQEVIYWLKSWKNPLLVQLPKSEYVKVQEAWGLPVL
ncbi:MAG: L,D-transpeptidase [Bacteroidia bacterium]